MVVEASYFGAALPPRGEHLVISGECQGQQSITKSLGEAANIRQLPKVYPKNNRNCETEDM